MLLVIVERYLLWKENVWKDILNCTTYLTKSCRKINCGKIYYFSRQFGYSMWKDKCVVRQINVEGYSIDSCRKTNCRKIKCRKTNCRKTFI